MKVVYLFLCCISVFLISCKKSFLDKKPNDALVVPTTLAEIEAIANNDHIMNGSTFGSLPGPNPTLLIVGSDDYFIPDNLSSSFKTLESNVYVWKRNNVYSVLSTFADWDVPYTTVFYSNLALQQLNTVDRNSNNQLQWDRVKANCLFYRAYAFFQLSQIFSPVYNNTTASTDLGIPLRLNADISDRVNRSTVQQTYDQIINDLKVAALLIPDASLPTTVISKNRPSKPAVYGMLARVYLSMGYYDSALNYSSSCLQLYNVLMDYKNPVEVVPPNATSNPFLQFNPEVIFQSIGTRDPLGTLVSTTNARVDTLLYSKYSIGDLRKSYFFRLREPNRYSFRGSYDGGSGLFMGLATDEIYLIKAECLARKGNVSDAMNTLNALLRKRSMNGFTDIIASDATDALSKILLERRKELVHRGLRWVDLRRLNNEGANITIKRVVNGQTESLMPNDLRYVWPIPDNILGFNPEMMQNPR
jgi:tetratricopeptide (TPR) repeat protein